MDIGEVLSRAWQIIWKHKVLWIFGILAGCGGGGNAGGSSNVRTSGNGGSPFGGPIDRFFSNLSQQQVFALVAAVILFILIATIIAVFLGTIGKIGLVRGVQQADSGTERLSFGELFNGSLPYFWRVFLLNLLVGLIFAVVIIAFLLILIVPIITVASTGNEQATGIVALLAVCLIPLICLLLPVGWVVGWVIEQATIAIVIENLGMMDGLRRGWQVVVRNLGMIIVMALILGLGVGLIGGVIIGVPLLAIMGPLMLSLITGTDQGLSGGMAVSLLCLVGYLPVLILLNGILRSYIESAWTLTFLRLTRPRVSNLPGVPTA